MRVRIVNTAKCGCETDGGRRPLRYCAQHVDQISARADQAEAQAAKSEGDSRYHAARWQEACDDADRLAVALQALVDSCVDELGYAEDVMAARAALADHHATPGART